MSLNSGDCEPQETIRDEGNLITSGSKESTAMNKSHEKTTIEWRVRRMRLDDIEKCLVIWRQVELTESHQTVASAMVSDPEGFFVAELKPSGEVIGMCSGTLTRPDTAFMGFYAVDPDYQGIGIGRELWARTTRRLNSSINIGLYGVPMMSEKYKKNGFKVQDSVRMLIYESQPGQELRLKALKNYDSLENTLDSCVTLEVISDNTDELLIRDLIDYDAQVNGFSREILLRNYLVAGKEAHDAGLPLTLALIDRQCSRSDGCAAQGNENASKRDDSFVDGIADQMEESLSIVSPEPNWNGHCQVLGYGCIRADNTDGAMIGPLYADSSDFCELILTRLLESFPLSMEGKYSAMSLTSNRVSGDILERIGFGEMDQCSRMFTHFVPEPQAEKIFYIHSPNFSLF